MGTEIQTVKNQMTLEERYTQRWEHSEKSLDDFYTWLETVNSSQGTGLPKRFSMYETKRAIFIDVREYLTNILRTGERQRSLKSNKIPEECRSFERVNSSGDNSICCYAGLFRGYFYSTAL